MSRNQDTKKEGRKTSIQVYMDDKTKARIQRASKREKLTDSTFILRVLEAYLNVIDKK